MDPAKQQAITACGRCGQPEDARKHKTGTGEDDPGIFAAPGGACPQAGRPDPGTVPAVRPLRPPRSPEGELPA